MSGNARLVGLELAKARLAAINRSVDPIARGATNTTATQARQTQYIAPMSALFYDKAFLRRRMVIKRAGRKRSDARIIPSSSGIPVTEWPGWNYSALSPTRGRIYVRDLQGRKIAAGFVNPSAKQRKPVRTRGFKGANGRKMKPALGPSLAFFFRRLTTSKTIRWTNAFLQQEFERRMRRELAKYQ